MSELTYEQLKEERDSLVRHRDWYSEVAKTRLGENERAEARLSFEAKRLAEAKREIRLLYEENIELQSALGKVESELIAARSELERAQVASPVPIPDYGESVNMLSSDQLQRLEVGSGFIDRVGDIWVVGKDHKIACKNGATAEILNWAEELDSTWGPFTRIKDHPESETWRGEGKENV